MFFFLCIIQKREISLIVWRARPLAAKFCTKTKRTTFIRPLECAILLRIMNKKKKNSKLIVIILSILKRRRK
jgi:hypothetical protein